MLLESLLTKLTAAGLATKAAAGGTAVVLAAGAAGAAGALPEPAQDALDGLVSVEEAEVAEAPEVDDAADEAAFGTTTAADATGEADGEPGVDGRAIACAASEGRSGTCDDEVSDEVVDEEPEEGSFGARVSADATGESDGEPGVDGEQISTEARAMNPGGPEGTAGEDAAARGRDNAAADRP